MYTDKIYISQISKSINLLFKKSGLIDCCYVEINDANIGGV